MKTNPLISIIIPCYNQAAYLPKSLHSIQAQSYQNWECLIIDDGSTDNSAEIIRTYCQQDNRFHLFQKENGGSATARNLGLQKVKGEYIQFLDADDSMDNFKLERQLSFMQERQVDMSYTGFRFLFENGEVSKYRFARLNERTVLTRWGLGSSIPPHAFLYRKDFIISNNITFDNNCRYREDWNWLIQCFEKKPAIDSISDYCGAYYFQNQTGKTSSYVKMQKGNFIFMAYKAQLFHGLNKFLWTYRISEELWIWLLRIVKHHNLETIRSIKLLKQNKESRIMLFAAIILMPISLLYIIYYFIKTYITR